MTSENTPAMALERALAALELRPEDAAAVALARSYAALMDPYGESYAEMVKEFGPKLQSILESLGMTPKGRAQIEGKRSNSAENSAQNAKKATLLELRGGQARK